MVVSRKPKHYKHTLISKYTFLVHDFPSIRWLYPLPSSGAPYDNLPQFVLCAREIQDFQQCEWQHDCNNYNLIDSKVKPSSDRGSFTQINSHVKFAFARYSDSGLDRDTTIFLLQDTGSPNKYTIRVVACLLIGEPASLYLKNFDTWVYSQSEYNNPFARVFFQVFEFRIAAFQ